MPINICMVRFFRMNTQDLLHYRFVEPHKNVQIVLLLHILSLCYLPLFLGMLPMCSPAVRLRLLPVLERLGLPAACDAPADRVMAAVAHDKKAAEGRIQAILVEKVGTFTQRSMTLQALRDRYVSWFGEGKA